MKKAIFLAICAVFLINHTVYAQELTNNTSQAQKSSVYNKANPLGLTYSENSINEVKTLIGKQNLTGALQLINGTIEWLEKSTEYHASLYKTLKGVKDAKEQAKVERELALNFAMLRDDALYQRAIIQIKLNKQNLAVKDLVAIVQSQPSSELGFSAYQKLQEIGFTYKVIVDQTQVKEIQ